MWRADGSITAGVYNTATIGCSDRIGRVVRTVRPKLNRSTLVLTDNLLRLRQEFQARNLPAETEARWRLVETAWDMRVPSRTLKVKFDDVSEQLFIDGTGARRIGLTGCRDALNGYQKGRCFYCFRDIALQGDDFNADIDHFFP